MRTTRTRTAAVALTAVALSLSLAACGQSSAGGSKEEKGGGKGSTIGIAMPTKSSERWIADGRNMVAEFKKLGYKTDLQYGEDDVDQQVSQIENMITKGVDVLVVAAIDGRALSDVLRQAGSRTSRSSPTTGSSSAARTSTTTPPSTTKRSANSRPVTSSTSSA